MHRGLCHCGPLVAALAVRLLDLRLLVADAPFDVVISRAFSDLATFARLASPLVASDGVLIAMKGARASDEIAALPPNVAIVETPELDVPGLDAKRQLVVMRVISGARQ